jgi:hypothetical protein
MESMDNEERWMWHMRRGEFNLAWQVSDSALRQRAGLSSYHSPRHLQPIWNGTSLENKRVLVRCYHGLGDTIQFIRYMPLLKAIATEVTVWAQPALIPLLSTVEGIDRLLPLHDGTPDCDYDIDVELMELPHVFRTTLETLPATVPYIHVDPAPVPRDRLSVGLTWRAGDWDQRRNVPFHLITKLAEVPEVTFYILQQDTACDERHERFRPILDPRGDALATAQVVRALDLVVSVDSMPAHLAGALGVHTWTLLQKDADWRWMIERNDSPWYPTMRLFRQEQPQAWEPVMARVAVDLECFKERFKKH